MTDKQKVILVIIAVVALIGMLQIPKYVELQSKQLEVVAVWNDQGSAEELDRCPFCNSTEVYGGGFTQLEISEHDLGSKHIQPYRSIPVVACNNCGAIRLDFSKINNQLMPAMEMLDERLQ